MRRKRTWLFGLWLVAVGVARGAPVSVTAPRCHVAPVLDGRLDDACWAAGKWSTGFQLLGEPGRQAPAQTRFQFCSDGRRLFLAVRAEEPNLPGLKAVVTGRDQSVFRDDCVELFIDPDGDQVEYFHIAVNPLGTVYDSQVRQGGHVHTTAWNAGIEARSGREAGAWTVELAVPLAELGLTARSRQPWGVNLARERHAGGTAELSTFVPLNGGFHQPTQFAALRVQGADLEPYLWSVRAPYRLQVVESQGRLHLEARTHLTNQGGRFGFAKLVAELVDAQGTGPAQTVTVGLDSDQGRELTLTVPVARQGEQMLRLSVLDRATSTPLSVQQFPVNVRYTPLAIRLTRPSYRNTIYATQRLDAVAGQVVCGLPEAALAGHRLRVRLQHGETVLSQTADLPVARETEFRVPLKELAEGRYEVVASLHAGDREAYRAVVPLAKVPPAPVEIRIDEHRVTRLNGQPLLPLGWFSPPPDEYRTIKDYGCNVFFDYNAQYRKDAEQLVYLDAVAAAGLMVASYPYPSSAMMSDEAWGRPLSADEAERLRQRVRALKGHRAVFGWYLADEPELRPALPERLAEVRRVIAEEDPYHPCVMLNDSLDGVAKYREGGDILMPDPYPLFIKGGLAAQDLGKTSRFIQKAVESSDGWRGTYVVPQAFNYGDYGRANNRAPNLTELRNQWWQAVVNGATGCAWYTYAHTRNYPDVGQGIPFVTRETRLLEPWVLALESSRPVAVAPAGAPVQAVLRTVAGQPLLIAVSCATAPVDAELTLPDQTTGRWYVVSEGRSVSIAGGRLRDRFGTYAVHLYTPDQALAGRYSLAAVTGEIAAQEAARRRPGNLAFEDLGPRVQVSSRSTYGSTPERVIDGVIGGMVWRNGQAGKWPEWLAVEFKQAATVGRLVVYSADIGEATAQGRVGGQWRDLAPLRRVDAQRLEAAFAPLAVEAVRVWVTAAPGRFVTISEVEAYAR